jgi:hypothetical protein
MRELSSRYRSEYRQSAATPQNGDDNQKKNRTNPHLELELIKDCTD